MRWIPPILLFLLPAFHARAQEPAIVEIERTWTACETMLLRTDWKRDDWTGWRRDFGNGYGDHFKFWDGNGAEVSALSRQFFIDGIATELETSCFRKTGELAFVLVEMLSPNIASSNANEMITRQGRIYVTLDGRVIRVTGEIVDASHRRLADLDSTEYQLARDCPAIDLHLTVSQVATHQTSEQGDQTGKRPAYMPNLFDWCAIAKSP